MFKAISAKTAALLDKELMSSGAYSIDQLMELAGLAVAKAIYQEYPPAPEKTLQKILVLVGPGNNGGDGLVCARHLKLWNYAQPVLYYPKRPEKPLYVNLSKQLEDLGVERVHDLVQVRSLLEGNSVKVIVDALFGFSFGPPIREPFVELIKYLREHSKALPPIVSVDIPSGWDVDAGPGDCDIGASMLVSLTAPKPCSEKFNSAGKVHYLGGRFINRDVATRYGIEDYIDLYENDSLVVKLQ
ncbi:hypothetical protein METBISCDRAFT_24379 [Metschnikowia bicuspidata]|uniref:NAD(P)H-hydrate epimerase n=1 Tax=Metschnikowia bicuspidata TaxID=27322 RepID=A0A4V1J2P6_9ASCO|nr:hypothetical protein METBISCDRAFT_24379 [Metschnikowia bicuspidata]